MRVVVALWVAAWIVAPVCATAAEPPAVVTLLEGPAGLLRGTARFALAEGVRVQSGDIIEVGEKGLAQIEFADGAIISLGPRSRFYAASIATRGAKNVISDFYLMQGWTKIASGKSAAPSRYTTPLFGFGTTDATAVAQIADLEGSLFVETGEIRLAEGFVKASPTSPLRLRAGQFYTRKSDHKGVIQSRPGPSFVSAMPKNYFDNLPERAAKLKDRDVAPRKIEDLTYSDVEMWLKSPLEIRRPIMQRFISKADDPAFRRALIANMKFHPEWDRILFPEKYKPKPPPEPPRAPGPQPQATQSTATTPFPTQPLLPTTEPTQVNSPRPRRSRRLSRAREP